ncbi:MAG: hypothetical protein JWM05_3506 [Acidimicrobiales bacterium]|nr:hypothetical protein [Acidimicrobiales bacterium]
MSDRGETGWRDGAGDEPTTTDDAPADRPHASDKLVEDGERPADPMAPGESILAEDGDIVEPNEPA